MCCWNFSVVVTIALAQAGMPHQHRDQYRRDRRPRHPRGSGDHLRHAGNGLDADLLHVIYQRTEVARPRRPPATKAPTGAADAPAGADERPARPIERRPPPVARARAGARPGQPVQRSGAPFAPRDRRAAPAGLKRCREAPGKNRPDRSCRSFQGLRPPGYLAGLR